MIPMEFKEANKKLLPPKGITDEECGTLPIYSDGQHLISC
jgi:hypothetical protein